MARRFAVAGMAVLGLLIGAASARADGLPVPTDYSTPDGVASADGVYRYVTLPVARGTLVERVERRGGRVVASRFLHGDYTVPVVAINGTPGGLSHDGSTLALIKPRSGFPRANTPLLFISTRHLAVRGHITLRGDFSFDAISPDGRSAYLVHYQSKRDPTKYEVRSFDVAAGALSPGAIVDPRERGEQMHGYPLARATSPDGRWDYTLYDGGSGGPFIHALDTAGRQARCVDLPAGALGNDIYSSHLRVGPGGGTLTVVGAHGPAALVDTSTFRVSRPLAHRPVAAVHGGRSFPWALVAGAAGALVLAALLLVVRLSGRRPLESSPARGDVRVVKGDGL
jgi:hypothetical protein